MRRWTILSWVLAALALAALLVRCLAIAEPLGIDQSLWASAVRGMARGQRLYRDVWEQRPPGIYWIYLTGFRVFGWTDAAVAWLDILASAATTGLVFALGRRLASTEAGAAAAALYAVLTMPAGSTGMAAFSSAASAKPSSWFASGSRPGARPGSVSGRRRSSSRASAFSAARRWC